MAKFVVDRRTWYRGKGPTGSCLLTKDGLKCCIGFVGEQCCIGFVGEQCGIPDAGMKGLGSIYAYRRLQLAFAGCPLTLDYATEIPASCALDPKWPEWMQTSHDIDEAYKTNDDILLSDQVREAKLKEIFARHGDEIVFEN